MPKRSKPMNVSNSNSNNGTSVGKNLPPELLALMQTTPVNAGRRPVRATTRKQTNASKEKETQENQKTEVRRAKKKAKVETKKKVNNLANLLAKMKP